MLYANGGADGIYSAATAAAAPIAGVARTVTLDHSKMLNGHLCGGCDTDHRAAGLSVEYGGAGWGLVKGEICGKPADDPQGLGDHGHGTSGGVGALCDLDDVSRSGGVYRGLNSAVAGPAVAQTSSACTVYAVDVGIG
jgi:hypothetical protein